MKIRAYVRMDEINKVHFYKDFEIVGRNPEVDDIYINGEEIKEVYTVQLDREQGSDEVYRYNYYHIIMTQNKEFDKGNDVYTEEFIAVEKPQLRVGFHCWKEGSGYSHSETVDHVDPDDFEDIESAAEEYYDGLDDKDICKNDYDAVNIEIYNTDDNLVSEYWVKKMRYYIDPNYIYGDFSEQKWALHEVNDNNGDDEIILWNAYNDTPGCPKLTEQEALDGKRLDEVWQAVENYIEKHLGFVPEYEIN